MTKKLLTITLFFGVVVAATFLVSQSGAQAVGPRQVKEWEYMTESSNGNEGLLSFERLNAFGSNGWELVQVCPKGEHSFHYVFKKLKNGPGAK